jgi:hypothetical protein
MYNFRGKKEKLSFYFLLNRSQNSNKNIVLAAVQLFFWSRVTFLLECFAYFECSATDLGW